MPDVFDFSFAHETSLLKNIFINAPFGILETDKSLRVRLANPAACRLFRDGETVTDLSMYDLVREKNKLDRIARDLWCEETKRHEGKITPALTKFHTEFKIIVTLSRDDDFNVTGFLFMCEDLQFYAVCCVCRKVRAPEGWMTLEDLMRESAALSHTYCPDCMPGALAMVQNCLHSSK